MNIAMNHSYFKYTVAVVTVFMTTNKMILLLSFSFLVIV